MVSNHNGNISTLENVYCKHVHLAICLRTVFQWQVLHELAAVLFFYKIDQKISVSLEIRLSLSLLNF